METKDSREKRTESVLFTRAGNWRRDARRGVSELPSRAPSLSFFLFFFLPSPPVPLVAPIFLLTPFHLAHASLVHFVSLSLSLFL